MTSDFNWVEELDQIEEEYFSFQVDFPETVRCYSLFLDPSYKIDRSASSTLSLSNGEINKDEMSNAAPLKVNAPDGDYRRLLVFSYATSIVDARRAVLTDAPATAINRDRTRTPARSAWPPGVTVSTTMDAPPPGARSKMILKPMGPGWLIVTSYFGTPLRVGSW